MFKRFTPFFVIFYWLFSALSVHADAQSAQQLLQKMDENAAALNYSGTLVYSRGNHMETLKRYHAVIDGVRRERLVHLSGKPRETIRTGEEVICLDSRGMKKFGRNPPDRPFSRMFSEAVLAEGSVYQVSHQGDSRVAGRPVIQLQLIPRDSDRYGFQLSLDKETQLLMQSLMLDEKGEIIERYEYSEISIGEPIAAAKFESQLAVNQQDSGSAKPSKKAHGKKPGSAPFAKSVAGSKSSSRWQVGWVPQAFEVQGRKAKMKHEEQTVSSGRKGSLMFSDGLSTFTVFVADNVNLGERTHRNGPTAAVTKVKVKAGEGGEGVYSVTVVGEIPRSALARVAQSVRPVDP